MQDEHHECSCLKAYEIQIGNLREDLMEVKERVQQLETTLARGVMLLIANLTAVTISLARQLIQT